MRREKSMRVGDLVLLRGSLWSSYDRKGDIGLVLETEMMANRSGYPDAEYSRVLWSGDGQTNLCKSDHLEVL